MEKNSNIIVFPQNIKKATALTAVRLLSAHCCVKQPHYKAISEDYMNINDISLCWFWGHWHFDFGLSWHGVIIFLHVCIYIYVKNRCIGQSAKCQMMWPTFVGLPIIILRFENVYSDCLSGTWQQAKIAGYHKHKSVAALLSLCLHGYSLLFVLWLQWERWQFYVFMSKRQWQWMVI